jgi:hypothetical protein
VKRLIIPVLLLVGFAYLVFEGGRLGDFNETESVASVMCLSCMGIE